MGDTSVKPRQGFSFTCPEHLCRQVGRCEYTGDKDRKMNKIEVKTAFGAPFRWEWSGGDTWESYSIDRFPRRCTEHDTQYRKYKRTKRQLQKLLDFSFEEKLGYPKMVTIPLLCVPDDERSLAEMFIELKKKFNKWRRSHQATGLIVGGVYAVECTTNVIFDGHLWRPRQGEYLKVCDVDPFGKVKHHPHIHAVVCMPFLTVPKLKKFTASGEDFGLGQVHVKGKPDSVEHWDFAGHLAHYLSKYITKSTNDNRSATFGAKFIGWTPPEESHGEAENSN